MASLPLPNQTVSNSRHLCNANAPFGTPSKTISKLYTKSWSIDTLVYLEKTSRTLLFTRTYSVSRVSSLWYALKDDDIAGSGLFRLEGLKAREESSVLSASLGTTSIANGLYLLELPESEENKLVTEGEDMVTSEKLFKRVHTINERIIRFSDSRS